MSPEESAVLVERVERELKMTVPAIAEYLKCSVASIYLWKNNGLPEERFIQLQELLQNPVPVIPSEAVESAGVIRVSLIVDIFHPNDRMKGDVASAIKLLQSIETHLSK